MSKLNLAAAAIVLTGVAVAAAPSWRNQKDKARLAESARAHLADAEAACTAHDFVGCTAHLEFGQTFALGAMDADLLEALLAKLDYARALGLASSAGLPSKELRPLAEAARRRLSKRSDPESRQAVAAIDVCLFRSTGADSAARSRGEKAISDGDDSVWLQWQLGSLALTDRRPQDAIVAFGRVTKAMADFAPALHRTGVALLADDRRDEGIAMLQRAAAASSEPEIHMDLARTLLAGEKFAEAQAPLEAVLRANRRSVEAMRLLAMTHYNLKGFDKAAELYQSAWSIESDPRTLLSAAISQQSAGKNDAALATLGNLNSALRSVPEIGFLKARVLADLGRTAEAREAFVAYLQVAENNPEEATRVEAARAALKP